MIASNYQNLLHEIADEAQRLGRDPASIKLIAVTKTQPEESIQQLYAAGCRNFGENRVQEGIEKIPLLPQDAVWHLIGTLQKNKVRKAVESFDAIHSVDSLELAHKISDVSLELGKRMPIFIQINCSEEESKHGFSLAIDVHVMMELSALRGVELQGLMTIAPFTEDTDEIRVAFQRLRGIRDHWRDVIKNREALPSLSMGMTQDWRIALEEGATHLRIGTRIFGERNKN